MDVGRDAASGGNKHKNPQLDNVQRVRDLGTLRYKCHLFIKSFHSELSKLCRIGDRKTGRANVDRECQANTSFLERENRNYTLMNSQSSGVCSIYTRIG